jgi:DNA-binding transcriptional LysR family regulator
MSKVLDIVPLRSFVAIADSGGFHRAALRLSLTQSAVSQHVRKLEAVLGTKLVEPSGRGTRFTRTGEALLTEARQILASHDQAVERLVGHEQQTLMVGTTEHAADDLLPEIMAQLATEFPDLDVQFRFDRTTRLNEAVDQGSIDVAVYVAEASNVDGVAVGALPLRWCSSPDFELPAVQPLPLVAIQAPCTIRSAALSALSAHDIPARVVADGAYLAGVINGARAGLGVALVALPGSPPAGLVERFDLPEVAPVHLMARVRHGADAAAADVVLRALRSTLARAEALAA